MENHGQISKKKKKKKRFPQLKNFDEFHQQSLFFSKIYQITTSYWLEHQNSTALSQIGYTLGGKDQTPRINGSRKNKGGSA